MKTFLMLLLSCTAAMVQAQGFAINTSGAAAHSSAMLDVSSTSKGVLVPRMSTAQRTAVAAPASGLLVYDSDLNQFAYYDGASWLMLSTTNNSWTVSGSNQYSSLAGNVGIGAAAPAAKLHVTGNIRVDNGKIPVVNSSNSVYIGNNAGTGDNLGTVLGNTAVGTNCMAMNTGGFSNTAVGYEAMHLNNTAGSAENTAIGAWAFRNNTSGRENTILGSGAGMSNISGNKNTFIGRFSGRYATGSNNVFLGYQAGLNETGSDKLYIDNSSTSSPLIYGNFAADSLKINGTLTVNNAYTFPLVAGTAGYVLQTNGSGQAAWVNPASLSITETDPQVVSAATNRVPKWNGAALADGIITDNGTNIGIGATTPASKLHVKGTITVDSGRIEFSNTGQSVFIGEEAGLSDNFTTNGNTFIGYHAGRSVVNGISNVAVGHGALRFSVTGIGNTAIGESALSENTGTDNTAIGRFAGAFNQTGSNNVFIGRSAGSNETGSNKLYIDNSSTTSPLIYGDFAANVLTVNGNMGIGTATPTQAKLVVSGSGAQTFASYGYLNRTHPTGTINGNTTANDYSIYTTDRIAAPEFNAFSDARIKKIRGITNSREDLETLSNIEVTDYTLKDSISKGNNSYKKVIAQQVEKVYPRAVSKLTGVIPDIYKLCKTNGKDFIYCENTGLKTGDKVKLILKGGEKMVEIKSVTAAGFSFTTPPEGFSGAGDVFVYGREVSDFRSVDYEAISMLNVSATQELHRQLRRQQEMISEQAEKIELLIQQLKKLKQQQKVIAGAQ